MFRIISTDFPLYSYSSSFPPTFIYEFLQHQHPYISAMVNNGTLHYDHDRDGTHTQLEGCEAKFRNFDYDTHIAIRYEKDTLTGSYTFRLVSDREIDSNCKNRTVILFSVQFLRTSPTRQPGRNASPSRESNSQLAITSE